MAWGPLPHLSSQLSCSASSLYLLADSSPHVIKPMLWHCLSLLKEKSLPSMLPLCLLRSLPRRAARRQPTGRHQHSICRFFAAPLSSLASPFGNALNGRTACKYRHWRASPLVDIARDLGVVRRHATRGDALGRAG